MAACAYDAVLELDDGADDRAPGGAITQAVCGSWDHAGPCPLAPHQTTVHRDPDDRRRLRLRCVLADDDDREAEVLALVAAALDGGRLTGPDGGTTTWRVLSQARGGLADDEHELAWRLGQNRADGSGGGGHYPAPMAEPA